MARINALECYKGESVTFYFGMEPATFTTAGVAAGAAVLPVKSTDGYAASGTAYVLNLDSGVVTAVTYTGTTPTSLTGCGNVPALARSGMLVTAGGTDVTGWAVAFTVKTNPDDAATLLTANATVTSGAGGILSVALTSTQTKTTLGVGEFAYDLQRTTASAEKVLSVGSLAVKQEVLY